MQAMLKVLNAFRHQRKEHAAWFSTVVPIQTCSTPFGINGRNTRPRRAHGRGRHVLNAFRHQRKEHWCKVYNAQSANGFVLNAFRHQRKEHGLANVLNTVTYKCSTPFGINGRNTAS